MLVNASVNMPLDEFDRLRGEAQGFEGLRRLIAKSAIIDTSEYKETGNESDIVVKVSLESIEKLIKKYGTFGKTDSDFFNMDEVQIVYKDKPVQSDRMMAEVFSLVCRLNDSGRYCVFFEYSGHVETFNVRAIEGEWTRDKEYFINTGSIRTDNNEAILELRNELLSLLESI